MHDERLRIVVRDACGGLRPIGSVLSSAFRCIFVVQSQSKFQVIAWLVLWVAAQDAGIDA
jgi:hypothetical protein